MDDEEELIVHPQSRARRIEAVSTPILRIEFLCIIKELQLSVTVQLHGENHSIWQEYLRTGRQNFIKCAFMLWATFVAALFGLIRTILSRQITKKGGTTKFFHYPCQI